MDDVRILTNHWGYVLNISPNFKPLKINNMYIKFYLHYAPLNITGIVTELKTEYFNDLEKCMERAEHLFQSGSQYVKVLREDGAIFCELEY